LFTLLPNEEQKKAGSKLEKAQEIGVKVVDEGEFLGIVGKA